MRRYREFVWLRTNFKLDASHKERKVPELPPKSIFKSFSDKKFHDERLRGLETFLKAIVTDEMFMDESSTCKPFFRSITIIVLILREYLSEIMSSCESD